MASLADLMSAKPEEGDESSGSSDYKEGLKSAMKSLAEALKSGDFDAAADAFETASSLCEQSESDDYDDKDEPKGPPGLVIALGHGKK